MALKKKLVLEFAQLYKHRFGEELSYEDARNELIKISDLVRLVITAGGENNG